jgi:actin-related protein
MTTEKKTTAASATGRKRRRSSPKTAASTKKKPATTTSVKTTKNAKATTKRKQSDITAELPLSPPPSRVLLVDNGGDTIKYGWIDNHGSDGTAGTAETAGGSPSSPSYPHSIANASARLMHQFTTLVGDELNQVQNPNSLMARTRSTERGMICNLENQTRVWKRMLDLLGVLVPTHTITAKCLGWKIKSGGAAAKKKTGKLVPAVTGTGELPEKTILPQTIGVILLLPPHCPRILLDQIFTVWMEDFCVSHVGLGISGACASYDQSLRTPWKTSCTVDLGWSSTLIVPTFKNKLIQGTGYKKSKDKDELRPVSSTVRRMPFGGRHMINMMKYYMSYRQYNLMDQELLMRDVFERLSYISTDIEGELRIARNKPSGRRPYDRDFVLPDYSNTTRGEIRLPFALQRDIEKEENEKREEQRQEEVDEDDDEDEDEDFSGEDEEDLEDEDFDEDEDMNGSGAPKKANKKEGKEKKRKKVDAKENDDSADDDEEESIEEKRKRLLRQRAEDERRKREQQEEEQVLRVSLERFTVPEVLFRPIDAGLQSDLVGLSQAIVQSVEACPEPYRPALYRTVYLVGGLALLPNLVERLKRELRSLVPSEYDVDICIGDSPIDRAWMGAKSYFEKEHYTKSTVSRQEWEESSKRKAYKKLLIENGGCYT